MAHSRLSDADLYARELFPKKHGYPLWMPEPYTNVDTIKDVGVSIGDVGYVTEDGAFQFLFNVRVGADHPVNQFGVPDGFEPIEIPAQHVISSRFHMTGSVVASKFGVQKTIGGGVGTPESLPANAGFEAEWAWNTTHGAALHLPRGAHRIRCRQEVFRDYIFQHAQSWYEFAADQTHDVANDGLVLITCCDKTDQWMVGAFSHESAGSSVSLYIGAMSMGQISGSYSYTWGNAVDPSFRQWPEPVLPNNRALAASASPPATSSSSRLSLLNDCSPEGQTHCVFFKGYRIGIRESVLTKDKRVTVSKLETQPPEWRKRGESQTFAPSSSFGFGRVGNIFGSVWSKSKPRRKSDDHEPLHSTFPTAFSSPRPRPRPVAPIADRPPPRPVRTERVITAEFFPHSDAPCSPHSMATQLLFDLNPSASMVVVHDDDWLPFYDDAPSYPLLLKAGAPIFSRIKGRVAYFDLGIQHYDSRNAFPPRAIWFVVLAKVKFLALIPERPKISQAYHHSAPRAIVTSNQRLGPVRSPSDWQSFASTSRSPEHDVSGSRARNVPCVYWAKGQCRFGENCRFSHDQADLASSPTSQASGEYKTRVCRNWERTGFCRYGSACHFAHGPTELRPSRDADNPICWDYAEKGYCPRGDTCRFIHESHAPILSRGLAREEGSTTAWSDVPLSRFSSDIDTQSTLLTDIDRDSDDEPSASSPAEKVIQLKTSQATLRQKASRTSLRKKRTSFKPGERLPRRQSFSEDSNDEGEDKTAGLPQPVRHTDFPPLGSPVLKSPFGSPNLSSPPASAQAPSQTSPRLPQRRRISAASQKKRTPVENTGPSFSNLSDVDI